MENFKHYLNLVKESKLRHVSVSYDTGDTIQTSMAAHLTDDDIKKYFAKGKTFNIGFNGNDKMAKVVDVIINESFGEHKIEEQAIDFLLSYGAKYIGNDASILEFLQNTDEDNSDDKNVKKLKQTLKTLFKSYKDADNDTVHLIPINGNLIEHFVEYVGDNIKIKNYVLKLDSKDWIKSLDGYLYFVTDVKNRLNNIKESMNSSDLINILQKYTTWLIDNKYVENNQNPTEIVNQFLQKSESVDKYNVMALTVPPMEQWRTINISSTIGDTISAFDYMDSTWCIQPSDLELVKNNIGNDIRFKYDATTKLRYMFDIVTKKK